MLISYYSHKNKFNCHPKYYTHGTGKTGTDKLVQRGDRIQETWETI